MSDAFLTPDWPVSPRVRALTTQRYVEDGLGQSQGPWARFNLGDHVGDDPAAVAANRRQLEALAQLPSSPQWLSQVHGTRTVALPSEKPAPEADAAFTAEAGVVCAILTADCLPVLLATRDGSVVGIAHAGWRGLVAGVIESLITKMPARPVDMVAWLGPAIGPEAFQVGDEVRQACLDNDPGAQAAFVPDQADRWLADLSQLAARRLQISGVADIVHSGECTWSQPQRYFSHRRQAPCGRMASLIWIEESP